jgi:hypothetical protein
MTFLITTGGDVEALRAVGDTLLDAGMAAARPSVRDEQWTLQRWHQEVLARQHGVAVSVQKPGRLWEQLAVDILLANMQAECWGWSGPDALPLLDFWASFEAQTRFILLCEPYEGMLSRFLVSDAPLDSLHSTVEQWHRTHEALLRFHLRHPSTSTLLWSADVVACPVPFIAHLATAMEVPALKADERLCADTRPEPRITNPLRAFVAEQLTSAFPEASALAHEMAASIRRLSEPEETNEVPERAFGAVRNGPELALELLRGYREESQRHEAAIAAVREENLRSLSDQERDAQDRTDRASGELKAVADENELLLAQLHQVQEELERLFLEQAQANSELEKQSQSNSVLAEKRDADAQARAVALAERDAMRQELDAQKAARADADEQARVARATVDETTARLNDTAKENELLLAQLHQVQEELERLFVEHAQAKSELKTQAQSMSTLAQQRDADAHARVVALAECDALRQEVDARNVAVATQQAAVTELQRALATAQSALHASEQKVQAASEATARLVSEKASEANAAAAALAARDALRQELDAQKAAVAERQQALATAQSALHASEQKVQAAAEVTSRLASEKASEANAAAVALVERDALRQQLDEQKAATADAEEQARIARTTVDETTARLNDTAQENELLLSQLHQVQEELERYFLEYSASRATAQSLETRLARLLGSLPGGFDCGALALVDSPEEGLWQWLAEDIRVAGRSVESLRYATRVEQGSVVLAILRDGATPGALLRWPLNARNESSVTLAALPDPQGGSTYLTHLAQLTTSDWEMMHGLLRQMVRQMVRGTIAVPPDQANGYAQAIGTSLSLIGQLAPVVRFDDSILTGQTVNARREVLGLRLSNVSFGRLRIPELELQFQAEIKADTTSGGTALGGVTCLIFGREAAAGPFEAWVTNASDASGKPVMGILATSAGPVEGPWDRLTPADQAFVVGLCDVLPLCLATLTVQDVRVKRPLKEWATLASELGRWLRQSTVPAPRNEPDASALVTASVEQVDNTAAVPETRTKSSPRNSVRREQGVVDVDATSKAGTALAPAKPGAKSTRTEKRDGSKPKLTPAKRTTPLKATPQPTKPKAAAKPTKLKVAALSRAPSEGGAAHTRTNAPVARAARPKLVQQSAQGGTKR